VPQTVTPYLLYEDVAGALEWLSRAFGFQETLRFTADDGTVNHAEMKVGDGAIMMGDPGPDYRNPRRSGALGAQVHVYVDDVDAHYERAKEAGADIRMEPTDEPYGDRRYDAYDVEGQLWSFATRLRDVPAEDWGATKAEAT
jgi:PhnB protein